MKEDLEEDLEMMFWKGVLMFTLLKNAKSDEIRASSSQESESECRDREGWMWRCEQEARQDLVIGGTEGEQETAAKQSSQKWLQISSLGLDSCEKAVIMTIIMWLDLKMAGERKSLWEKFFWP